jgi:hypothetical protein
MQWETSKTASSLKLDGITIETDFTGTSFNSLILTDANGRKIRVRTTGYSTYLEIPATPATEKKHVLSGTLRGLPVNEVFDDQWSADKRRDDLMRGIGLEDETLLTVEEKDIPQELPF